MFSIPATDSVSVNPGRIIVKNLMPLGIAGALGAGLGLLALTGMFRIEEDRVVLRNSTEALSFIQELTQFLGMFNGR